MLDRTEPTQQLRTAASSDSAPEAGRIARWFDRLPGPVRWTLRRWPALLALALVGPDVVAAALGEKGGSAQFLGEALPMLALIYLIMAKIGNRKITWPVVVLVTGTVAVTEVTGIMAPSTLLVGASLVLLVWVMSTGEIDSTPNMRLQAVGIVFFCGVALAGLAVDPTVGVYVIATGWFLHGMWDFVHIWRDRVVSKTFAEWCGVLDVLIAAQLVLM
ncbi:hypothetical protein [Rhodococcus sp. BL-253-APC-6A1W]|uniref:hypothetical protein n=1 Tax=Rhodococcus sp. BL-253-APC-6A1W TaxID=2725307 RepID=UPI0019818116|nr:hypothetical protein [Rhodococcus sp. BL-253-APC-6A1W]